MQTERKSIRSGSGCGRQVSNERGGIRFATKDRLGTNVPVRSRIATRRQPIWHGVPKWKRRAACGYPWFEQRRSGC